MNSSAVRKLTDLKANSVNYIHFPWWSLRTSCVKLSSHEHHGPLNYHDPCRAGSLLFDYFCKVDKSERWHQHDFKELQINTCIFFQKANTKQVLLPFSDSGATGDNKTCFSTRTNAKNVQHHVSLLYKWIWNVEQVLDSVKTPSSRGLTLFKKLNKFIEHSEFNIFSISTINSWEKPSCMTD